MPIIQIPNVYRGHTRREASIQVEGDTIDACLDAADAVFPGFRAVVVDAAGNVHRFNKLLLNGELLGRGSEVLQTPVSREDEIEVMAAIAGG